MPTFRVKTKNTFVTITNIKTNFNTPEADELIKDLFGDNLETIPYIAWESSCKSNDHVHIVFNLAKATQITRKTFMPLCELLGSQALNIQTMKQGKVYKDAISGKRYKGGKQGSSLWIAEKLIYCWCDKPEHECYFPKEKFKQKRATVVRTVQPECQAFYRKIMNIYEDWLNEKDETNATPKDIVRSAI